VGVSLDTLAPDTDFVFTALSDTEAIAGPIPSPKAEHCRPVASRPRPAPPDEKTSCRAIPGDDHVSKVRFAPAISKRDSL